MITFPVWTPLRGGNLHANCYLHATLKRKEKRKTIKIKQPSLKEYIAMHECENMQWQYALITITHWYSMIFSCINKITIINNVNHLIIQVESILYTDIYFFCSLFPQFIKIIFNWFFFSPFENKSFVYYL